MAGKAGMTAKQRRFCEEYIKDINATAAARRAGYSEKTAMQIAGQLMDRPHIRSYVDELVGNIQSANIAEAEEVMAFLTSVMRGEEVEQVPIGTGMGNQRLIDKAIAGKDRVKAAELLGRRYALFTDKMSVDGAIPVVIAGGDDLED